MRQSLVDRLALAKVVRVEVPGPTGNPRLDSFGRSANDPDFSAYLDELRKARANDSDPADEPQAP